MSGAGVYHAILLSYGRAAADVPYSYVRPMSADVNYGSTADLTRPSASNHEPMNAYGDFWVQRTGNTARRFNVLDTTGAVQETYTKGLWGFFPASQHANPYTSWPNSRACWYFNYGGEIGLMTAPGAGTFTTYTGGGFDNLMGTSGMAFGQEGFQLMMAGDASGGGPRLRKMQLFGGAIINLSVVDSGDTYRFPAGAFRENPERCYLQTGVANDVLKYYSFLSNSLVTVASGITPAMSCRGVMGLRQYDDPIPESAAFNSDMWTGHNGTPATIRKRSPSTGVVSHTVTLPAGYNTLSNQSALMIGPDGKVWAFATNGASPKVFACTTASASPVAESPALANSRVPIGITANNYMAFEHAVGAQLYYSLMRC